MAEFASTARANEIPSGVEIVETPLREFNSSRERWVARFAFLMDGSLLATQDVQSKVEIRDVETGELLIEYNLTVPRRDTAMSSFPLTAGIFL